MTQPPRRGSQGANGFPAFSPFANVDAVRYAPRQNATVMIGGQMYREVDNGRANTLVRHDPLYLEEERAAQREGIVRALFQADHTFGAMAYAVAAFAGSPQKTRDAVLKTAGLADDMASGRFARSTPVHRTPTPRGGVAAPTTARDAVRLRKLNDAGQATGVTATIEPSMLGSGTAVNPKLEPPGWLSGRAPYFDARGHLLARQLGGSGSDPRNLVTLTQRGPNHPKMSQFENKVAGRVRSGEIVEYSATPLYGAGRAPSAVLVTAVGSRGTPSARIIQNPAGRRR